MSNYYDYQSIKAKIAERLMTMDGWEVHGYKPDESDAMTDYWSPASWGGVAEKNGYILCVDVYGAAKETILYDYSANASVDYDKIRKLEAMTQANGASVQEEESAKKSIEKILAKARENENTEKKEIGRIPAHMENPGRCNWHIEKDGVYIAKGTGILQMKAPSRYHKDDVKEMNAYTKNPVQCKLDWMEGNKERYKPDRLEDAWEYHRESMEKRIKAVKKFEDFIRKVDSTCGGILGNGTIERYEKKIVTEYKKEIKAVESETGNIEPGQCFILKTSFNYGCCKGYVYRVKYVTNEFVSAVKLNRKLTKECNGTANTSNSFNVQISRLKHFIEKGAIAYCDLKTVKTPYEVEKIIKVVEKPEKETAPNITKESVDKFTVIESQHTKTGEKIFLVKCNEELSKEKFVSLTKSIKELGGYYSRFVHAFVFKENPTQLIQNIIIE